MLMGMEGYSGREGCSQGHRDGPGYGCSRQGEWDLETA